MDKHTLDIALAVSSISVMIATFVLAVTDRLNGATDDQVNGATFSGGLRTSIRGYYLPVFAVFSTSVFMKRDLGER